MATPLPRSQFPVTEHHIYLNHAGVAPLPQAAVDAMAADERHVADHGSAVEPQRFDRLDEVRLTAAALLGVPSTDVAFVKNTTEGLAFVAEGLDLPTGPAGDRARPRVPVHPVPLARAPRPGRAGRPRPARRGPGGALPLEAFAAALDEARDGTGDRQLGPVRHRLAHRPRGAGRPVPPSRRAAVRRRDPGPRACCPARWPSGASTSPRPTRTSGCWAPRASACSTWPPSTVTASG